MTTESLKSSVYEDVIPNLLQKVVVCETPVHRTISEGLREASQSSTPWLLDERWRDRVFSHNSELKDWDFVNSKMNLEYTATRKKGYRPKSLKLIDSTFTVPHTVLQAQSRNITQIIEYVPGKRAVDAPLKLHFSQSSLEKDLECLVLEKSPKRSHPVYLLSQKNPYSISLVPLTPLESNISSSPDNSPESIVTKNQSNGLRKKSLDPKARKTDFRFLSFDDYLKREKGMSRSSKAEDTRINLKEVTRINSENVYPGNSRISFSGTAYPGSEPTTPEKQVGLTMAFDRGYRLERGPSSKVSGDIDYSPCPNEGARSQPQPLRRLRTKLDDSFIKKSITLDYVHSIIDDYEAGDNGTGSSVKLENTLFSKSQALSKGSDSLYSLKVPDPLVKSKMVSEGEAAPLRVNVENPYSQSLYQVFHSQVEEPPSTIPGANSLTAEEKEKKYRSIILELIETEIAYHHSLSIVQDIYLKNLEAFYPLALNEQEKKSLFGNITKLCLMSYTFIKAFCTEVSSSVEEDSEIESIPSSHSSVPLLELIEGTGTNLPSMENLKPFIDEIQIESFDIELLLPYYYLLECANAYKEYLGSLDARQKLLKIMLVEVTEVGKWHTESLILATNTQSDCHDLASLLLQPLQRITRIRLILKSLKKMSSDSPGISRALEHVELILSSANFQASESIIPRSLSTSSLSSNPSKTLMNYNIRKSHLKNVPELRILFVNLVLEFKNKFEKLKLMEQSTASLIKQYQSLIIKNTDILKSYAQCLSTDMDPKIYDMLQNTTLEHKKTTVKLLNSIYSKLILCIGECENVRDRINQDRKNRILYHNSMITSQKGSNKPKRNERSGEEIIVIDFKNHPKDEDLAQQCLNNENLFLKELPVLNEYLEEFMGNIGKQLLAIQSGI